MNPKFIVFEGIDGSGTSTQALLLRDFLISKSFRAVITSEPSSGPVGNLIREGMKGRILFGLDEKTFDYQMAYLFAADRHDHWFNKVDGMKILLEKNDFVISTRYFFSSFAYHCSDVEDFEFVKTLNSKFPIPDLTIYIDLPVDISVKRFQNRAFKDKYENTQKLKKVKNNYDTIFSTYEGNLLRIDGSLEIEVVHHEISKYFEGNLLI